MKIKEYTPEPFEPDFDASDELTTSDALNTVEKFYEEKLKPLGDHAPTDSVAGKIEITQQEKNAIRWIAYQMREIQNARSKGGKSGGGGRPRKYKTASERQKAYLERKALQNKSD